MKKCILPALVIAGFLGISGLCLFSCDGMNPNSPGTIVLYLTDDPSVYTGVTATVTAVRLVNTATRTSCDLLTVPVTVDIAGLADVMQLVNVTECPSGPFNRIHLEFERGVQLVTSTGTTSFCAFDSYKTEGNETQPNLLDCNPATGICSMDINGAVNVFAQQNNKLALDFVLKDFVVNFESSPCSVTMKVSPLTSAQIRTMAKSEAVTGLVSRLSTTDKTFDLTRGNTTFHILYSGITGSDQPGLDSLLQDARDGRTQATVTAPSLDIINGKYLVAAMAVKAEGVNSDIPAGSVVER